MLHKNQNDCIDQIKLILLLILGHATFTLIKLIQFFKPFVFGPIVISSILIIIQFYCYMKKVIACCFTLFFTCVLHAQHSMKLRIQNKEDAAALYGASARIKTLNKTAIADSAGFVSFSNIAAGTYQIVVSFVGYEPVEISIVVPQSTDEVQLVLLEHKG